MLVRAALGRGIRKHAVLLGTCMRASLSQHTGSQFWTAQLVSSSRIGSYEVAFVFVCYEVRRTILFMAYFFLICIVMRSGGLKAVHIPVPGAQGAFISMLYLCIPTLPCSVDVTNQDFFKLHPFNYVQSSKRRSIKSQLLFESALLRHMTISCQILMIPNIYALSHPFTVSLLHSFTRTPPQPSQPHTNNPHQAHLKFIYTHH
jgi:hypothetical protein